MREKKNLREKSLIPGVERSMLIELLLFKILRTVSLAVSPDVFLVNHAR